MMKKMMESLIKKQTNALKKNMMKLTPEKRAEAMKRLREEAKNMPNYEIIKPYYEKMFKEIEDVKDK